MNAISRSVFLFFVPKTQTQQCQCDYLLIHADQHLLHMDFFSYILLLLVFRVHNHHARYYSKQSHAVIALFSSSSFLFISHSLLLLSLFIVIRSKSLFKLCFSSIKFDGKHTTFFAHWIFLHIFKSCFVLQNFYKI